jgi:hypothetical protein
MDERFMSNEDRMKSWAAAPPAAPYISQIGQSQQGSALQNMGFNPQNYQQVAQNGIGGDRTNVYDPNLTTPGILRMNIPQPAAISQPQLPPYKKFLTNMGTTQPSRLLSSDKVGGTYQDNTGSFTLGSL